MPPQPTETFPRIRRTGPAVESTRLDVQRRFEVADPTVVTDPPFDPGIDDVTMRTRQQVRVSPIGEHTRGAAASTPPRGIPYPREAHDAAPSPAETLNALLDDQARIAADTRTAWTNRPLFRTDRRKARTVREEAARRARQKLRHERHMERVETARAYLVLTIIFFLLMIVVGAAFVGWGILSGWFTWQLSR